MMGSSVQDLVLRLEWTGCRTFHCRVGLELPLDKRNLQTTELSHHVLYYSSSLTHLVRHADEVVKSHNILDARMDETEQTDFEKTLTYLLRIIVCGSD